MRLVVRMTGGFRLDKCALRGLYQSVLQENAVAKTSTLSADTSQHDVPR